MKYRKKPVVIEAEQFNNSADIHEFCKEKVREPVGENYLEIETLEGVMRADEGDYIIQGVNGEFYPCKPDIFDKTYDKADEIISGAKCSGGMNFGQAIEALKKGYRVARQGWNGKGMWLLFIGDWTVHLNYVEDVKDLLPVAWIGMRTADNCFVPWLASQTDMLAEDWVIIE